MMLNYVVLLHFVACLAICARCCTRLNMLDEFVKSGLSLKSVRVSDFDSRGCSRCSGDLTEQDDSQGTPLASKIAIRDGFIAYACACAFSFSQELATCAPS